jgi:hypothetical protein
MRKKAWVIALALLALSAVGTVFAEVLQCRDPADGSITVSFMGDVVRTTYSGKSAQTFQVVVLLKDERVDYLTFTYPKVNNSQTRPLQQRARGPIEKVTNCSFKSY